MRSINPFNIKLMASDHEVNIRQMLPVSSHNMFEATSTRFHPEGMYSEEIFGEINSEERFRRYGYIDLKLPVFHPHVYKTIITLKNSYDSILAGRKHAIFDAKLKDFIPVDSSQPGARTGFSFFLEHFNKIDFTKTDSLKRDKKIKIFETYKDDRLLTSKYIVSPAGIRDVEFDKDGRPSSEEINKLYLALLSLSQALPESADPELLLMYDGVRYSIQKKGVEIHDYLTNIFTGKYGFAQKKHASRAVVFGTRNVISAGKLEVRSPNDPNYLKHDETLLPTYQVAKQFQPFVPHMIKTTFIEPFMTMGMSEVPMIDPTDYKVKYIKLTEKEMARWQSSEGLTEVIDEFEDMAGRFNPVTVQGDDGKDYYLMLMYDNDDEVFMLRNIDDFKEFLDGNTQSTDINEDHKQSIFRNYHEVASMFHNEVVFIGSGSLFLHNYDVIPDDIDIVANPVYVERLTDEQKERLDELKVDFGVGPSLNWDTLDFVNDVVDIYGFKTLTKEKLYTFYEHIYNTVSEDKKEKYQKRLDLLKTDPTKSPEKKIEDAEVTSKFDMMKVRPMTKAEFLYVIVSLIVRQGYHTTTTRYPVIESGSVYVTKIKVGSTAPSRIVKFKSQFNSKEFFTFDRYPILGQPFIDSSILHLSHLPGLSADHDGDMVNNIGVWSEEANKENAKYLRSPASIVSASKKFISTNSNSLTSVFYNCLTRNPRED